MAPLGLARAFAASLLAALLAASLSACGAGSGTDAPPAGSTGGATGTGSNPTPTAVFMAGAATVDITPPPGAPLAGFGGPDRRIINAVTIPLQLLAAAGTCFDPNPSDPATFFQPAKGTLDPINAKALVLDNAITKIAIVKLDTIGT